MSWQKILAQGFTSVRDLLHYLELPVTEGHLLAEKTFPSRIPLGFAQRMQKGNLQDPLLLQVLPIGEELEENELYHVDPLMELNTNPLKGLLHKYYGRVLLTLTGICAVNCRYCFRRHFPYRKNNPGRQGWKDAIEYIAQDNSISEVILSGGDPLLASNALLAELIQSLETIPHVHTLRIHTRIPVVLPERIDEELLTILSETTLKKVLVIHCNHPQELNQEVGQICDLLKKANCILLNQSVLLAHINDQPNILAELSHALFSYGILPYYLHLLDKVKNTSHFDMPLAKAQEIYSQLQTLLPGYLLPKLAFEEPGKLHKMLIL